MVVVGHCAMIPCTPIPIQSSKLANLRIAVMYPTKIADSGFFAKSRNHRGKCRPDSKQRRESWSAIAHHDSLVGILAPRQRGRVYAGTASLIMRSRRLVGVYPSWVQAILPP